MTQKVVSQHTADSLSSQDVKEKALSSPYLALRAFLEVPKYKRESTLLSQLFAHPNYNKEERIAVAKHLRQVLDGTGNILYIEEIPQDPNYKDTLSGKHRYVLLSTQPSIYIEKRNGQWYFPRRAVDEIEKWHDKVFPFGMEKLLNLLPKMGLKKIGPFHLWQIGALLTLILLTVLLHKGLSLGTERLFVRFLLRRGYSKVTHERLFPVVRPFSWAIIFSTLWLFLPVLQLPARLNHYVILGLGVMAPTFFTITMYYFVDILHIYLLRWTSRTESTLDDQLVVLLRKALKIFVIVLGVLFVLDNLSVPILPLLTGLSLGGLAFALSAQDTIKNFFGSLMIFVDKPFQVGDWITCDDIDGTVEDIGFRSTRVRTFRDSLIYVPNAKLANSMVDNHGLRTYRRYYAKLCIPYGTSSNSIEAFVYGLRSILEAHPLSRKENYEIHLHEFVREGLIVMFYVFVRASSWSEELRARHELNISILQLAERLRIRFAYGVEISISPQSLSSSVLGQSKLSSTREKVRKSPRPKDEM